MHFEKAYYENKTLNLLLVITLICLFASTFQKGFCQDNSVADARKFLELEEYETSFKILKQLESKSDPEVFKALGDHYNFGLYIEEIYKQNLIHLKMKFR